MTYQDTILDIMEDRLNTLGKICVKDAIKECEDVLHSQTVEAEFRKIMQSMVELGKATKVSKGWNIIKPNSRINPIVH